MKKLIAKKGAFLIFTVIAILVLAFFLTALSNVDKEKTSEDRIQLEKAIINAAVSCYAIEGSYPPSIEYLAENYGLQIDTERFTVKYELYASNLMPDITVLVNEYEK
ncbi:MAG: hypothetical protein E7601_10170 [Ruminococcaceae bacterium]|nr:hypothetical protein [Oscillospiraceae bacterium]